MIDLDQDARLRTKLRSAYTHANARWGQGNRLKESSSKPRPITLATTTTLTTNGGQAMTREIRDSATLTKLDQQAAGTGDALPAFLKKKIAAKGAKGKGGGGAKKGKVPPAFLAQQGK